MRHFVAHVVTYAIAALIFLGAGAFAWVRSAQLTVVPETALMEPAGGRLPSSADWLAAGRAAYVRNCQNCHGVGLDRRDQGPQLGPVAQVLSLPGGREYVIDVVLYGLQSERWRAPMPRMGHMHDADLAAVLNYMAEWIGAGAPDPVVSSEEVSARRGARLRPAEVNGQRPR